MDQPRLVIPSEAKRGEGEPLRTASGRNFVGGEVNRNKWSPQCGATPIEVADIPCYVRGTKSGKSVTARD